MWSVGCVPGWACVAGGRRGLQAVLEDAVVQEPCGEGDRERDREKEREREVRRGRIRGSAEWWVHGAGF